MQPTACRIGASRGLSLQNEQAQKGRKNAAHRLLDLGRNVAGRRTKASAAPFILPPPTARARLPLRRILRLVSCAAGSTHNSAADGLPAGFPETPRPSPDCPPDISLSPSRRR